MGGNCKKLKYFFSLCVVATQTEPKANMCLECAKCPKKIVRDSEEHDFCHINGDDELICVDCVQAKKCDCENCEEAEYDTCQRCKDVVKVDYVWGEGYTIGDCDFTGRMLCRPCLDLMTKRYEIKRQNKMMKKGKFIIIEP